MRRQTDFFETESLTTFGQRGDKFYPYFFFPQEQKSIVLTFQVLQDETTP